MNSYLQSLQIAHSTGPWVCQSNRHSPSPLPEQSLLPGKNTFCCGFCASCLGRGDKTSCSSQCFCLCQSITARQHHSLISLKHPHHSPITLKNKVLPHKSKVNKIGDLDTQAREGGSETFRILSGVPTWIQNSNQFCSHRRPTCRFCFFSWILLTEIIIPNHIQYCLIPLSKENFCRHDI